MDRPPAPDTDPYALAREQMVRHQIAERGIRGERVLDAMRRVPRHEFVPPDLREHAYRDGPLAIGLGQTISQPYIVGAMTDMLSLTGGENVLEVGTGSGYQAAVLAEIVVSVHTIERHPRLAAQAAELLARLGYHNVYVHTGDGSYGWPEGAPYQAILVAAAAPTIPKPLVDQLAEEGTLVIPIGGPEGQNLERWRKQQGRLSRESLFPVAFVPMRGSLGWTDTDWQDPHKS